MRTKIDIVVFPDAEQWLEDNLKDIHTDRVAAVYPTSVYSKSHNGARYRDDEENTERWCSIKDHIDALHLLCEQIGRTLFVGGIKSPFDLLDAGAWDAEVADAYYQLVYYKEVRYG